MAQKFNLVDFTEATTDIKASPLNYDSDKNNLYNATQSAGKLFNDFLKIYDPTQSGLPAILTTSVLTHYEDGHWWFMPVSATAYSRIYRYTIDTNVWSFADITNTIKGTGSYRSIGVVKSNTVVGAWDIFLACSATAVAEAGVVWARGVPEAVFTGGLTVPAATAVTDGRTTALTTGAVFIIKDNNSANNLLQNCAACEFNSKTPGNVQIVWLDVVRRVSVLTITGADMAVAGALPRVSNTATPPVLTGINATVFTPAVSNDLRKVTISGVPYFISSTSTQIARFLFSNLTAGNTNWMLPADILTPAMTIPGAGNTPQGSNNAWTSMGSIMDLGDVEDIGNERFLYVPNTAGATMLVGPYLFNGIPFDKVVGRVTGLTDRVSDTALATYEKFFSGGILFSGANDTVNKRMLLTRNSSFNVANAASNQFLQVDYGKHNAYCILKKFLTPNAYQYGRVLRQGKFRDRCSTKLQYRTSGISTNTGAWTDISEEGDLTGVVPAAEIQFRIVFPIWDFALTTPEINVFAFTWTARSIEPEFSWYSPLQDGKVYWIQQTLFGGPVPSLTIRYMVNSTNSLIFEQDSGLSTNGSFEYFNGVAYVPGLGPDAVGTIRRFVPTVALGTMDVRAELRRT
jgi:hypothetical protein